MMLMNDYSAALMSSQVHAKSNKKEMLGAFVIVSTISKDINRNIHANDIERYLIKIIIYLSIY